MGPLACSPDEEEWRVKSAVPGSPAETPQDEPGAQFAAMMAADGPVAAMQGSGLRGASLKPMAPGASPSPGAPASPGAPGGSPGQPPPATPPGPPNPTTPAAPPAPPAPTAPPQPTTLPTWVPLDWAAFPVDRGPNYPAKRVWEVSQTGNDAGAGTATSPLRTIGAALARATAGDMVRVQSGTYAEGGPAQNFALQMVQDQVVLTAAPGAQVTVVPAAANNRFGILLRGSHLTVNAINLQGFHPAIHYGRDDLSQKNIVISNLKITATSGGFADGIASYLDARAKGFPIIDGMLIKKVAVAGAGLSISCNMGPCRSLRVEDVKVSGNGSGAGNSGSDAIAVEEGDNILFLRVDVAGAAADGIDMKATRVVVWDSRVHDVARNGVKLWFGGDVVNTSIYNTGADGALIVKSGTRVRLLHSMIANVNPSGEAYAMTFRYDDNGPIQVDIINSIITNTGGPIYVSAAAKLTMQNSVLFGSKNGQLLTQGPLLVTAATGAAMLGAGNLVVNPVLDAALQLSPTSPAVNKGKVEPAFYPVEDIDGNPRVKGGAPDIGPSEKF